MSDSGNDRILNKDLARETLANIRRMLKSGIKVSEVAKNDAVENRNYSKIEIVEPYVGTVEDLVKSIESAVMRQSDGLEFWSVRSLMPILGYGNSAWAEFLQVVLKAQYACERSDQSIGAHFSRSVESGKEENSDDIQVSRYGAYLIAQNGDARKKQVAFAQTYFATQTRRMQNRDKRNPTGDEHRRVAMRDKIAEHNKALAEAASNAGVRGAADFARFQNYGYRGLYNGLGVQGIREVKGLPVAAKILDHMDITELAANFFRTTQAEDKLRREQIIGKEEANAAHYEVGRKVRKAIMDIGGDMPELLPRAENIDYVRKRIAKIER